MVETNLSSENNFAQNKWLTTVKIVQKKGRVFCVSLDDKTQRYSGTVVFV